MGLPHPVSTPPRPGPIRPPACEPDPLRRHADKCKCTLCQHKVQVKGGSWRLSAISKGKIKGAGAAVPLLPEGSVQAAVALLPEAQRGRFVRQQEALQEALEGLRSQQQRSGAERCGDLVDMLWELEERATPGVVTNGAKLMSNQPAVIASQGKGKHRYPDWREKGAELKVMMALLLLL